MKLRRATGGLGFGAALTFALVHAVHVAVAAAPAAVTAAVSFVCRIH
jgi:hypothetical protein